MLDHNIYLTNREAQLLDIIAEMATAGGSDGETLDLPFDAVFAEYCARWQAFGKRRGFIRGILLAVFNSLRLKLHLLAGRPMIERVSGRGRGHRAVFRVLDIPKLLLLADRLVIREQAA
jgi:hypothetical protein